MPKQDSHHAAIRPSSASAADAEFRVQPSSSRMLTSYLSDVEQMLDERRWDVALRDAVDLPRIAVALGDPRLSSSSDRCRAWCEEWVRPNEGSDEATADRLCRAVCEC